MKAITYFTQVCRRKQDFCCLCVRVFKPMCFSRVWGLLGRLGVWAKSQVSDGTGASGGVRVRVIGRIGFILFLAFSRRITSE